MMENILRRLNSVPNDKVKHFVIGVFTFAALSWLSVSLACVAVVVAAIGKEIYDRLHPEKHTADLWDAAATVAGGAVAVFIKLF